MENNIPHQHDAERQRQLILSLALLDHTLLCSDAAPCPSNNCATMKRYLAHYLAEQTTNPAALVAPTQPCASNLLCCRVHNMFCLFAQTRPNNPHIALAREQLRQQTEDVVNTVGHKRKWN